MAKSNPWDFLDEYRGKVFSGQWPTLPQMLSITVKRYPNNSCFTIFEGTNKISLTYKEVEKKVLAIAAYLGEQQIKAGDKVVVTGKNSPQWALAYLGVLYAGCVVVPIDHQLSFSEASDLTAHSESKFVFCDEEKLDAFKKAKTKLKLKGISSLQEGLDNYILDVKTAPLSKLVARKESDLAAILYTSGTTGVAKGVMLTHGNFVADCYLSQGNLNIHSTDVFYVLLPIHHSYTMLAVFIEALSIGAELVFGKKLVITSIMNDLKLGKITMFLGVPALYNKLIYGILKKIRQKGIFAYGLVRFLMGISFSVKKLTGLNVGKKLLGFVLRQACLDKIRICISGGGPLPKSTFRHYQALGLDFVEGYGLTETAPILTLNPTEAFKIGSVGKVIANTHVVILDKDSDGRGEIAVKGPQVMQGYYKNEQATKEAFTDDGYFKTGDVGYLDKQNYLYLTGRAKSLIVTDGGKNVFPEEIENKFQLYDEIEQILVRGYLKDANLKIEGVEAIFYPSETYRAFDYPSDQIHSHFEEIVSKVNKELLPYKRITKVSVLDEPMEMTSKRTIKRHKVK